MRCDEHCAKLDFTKFTKLTKPADSNVVRPHARISQTDISTRNNAMYKDAPSLSSLFSSLSSKNFIHGNSIWCDTTTFTYSHS
ncbi:hypothetical protein Glove_103g74 [Diversispora epigaea]|uniref:Uncharacterized protein n=1 Tax=Diversispora epigaea TaxID=1348612 RepID=A0A397J475_9GLOM|nr:hypothetical protein Glove_103g74 [Diversispora epigaea]